MGRRLIAIVVTYNRCELLLQCVDALLAQTYRDFDILVVDNNSTDGTPDRLRRVISDNAVIYVNTGANLGGAGGFNYGIRYAYKLGYDLFWLMDDDTIASPDALQELIAVAEDKGYEFGYIVSKALWTDGSICKMNRPRTLFRNTPINADTNDTIRITRASFVSFLTPRSIVKTIGLPIKDFYIWADDTNYCLRINRHADGFMAGRSVVTHKMKINQGADIVTCSWDRADRFVFTYRNRYYNNALLKRKFRYYLSVCKTTVLILFCAKDNKFDRIQSMLEGVKQGRHFHPEIEYAEG